MVRSSETPWRVPGKWTTSQHNWVEEVRGDWTLPSKVTIHDATLRDGEQTPGVVFGVPEKLEIAHMLADMGVTRIEGGMVAVSPEDVEAVTRMTKEIKEAEIATFARTRKDDIDLGLKCGVGRIVMELGTPVAALTHIWGSPEKAVEAVVDLVKYVKTKGLKITLFLMGSTTAEMDLLESIIVPAVKEGKADNVCLADTAGIALPQAMAFMVRKVKQWVDVPVEVHVHDRWGMGMATTLAGVTAGAEVVHTTINGLNGNSSIDEIVIGLEGLLGIDTGIDTKQLMALSDMVRGYSKKDFYKPFLGSKTREVETGIGTQGMWVRRQRGEPMMEKGVLEQVGGGGYTIVLGKYSGRYSMMFKAEEFGLPEPSQEEAYKMLAQVKALSGNKRGPITDDEFKQIYHQVMG